MNTSRSLLLAAVVLLAGLASGASESSRSAEGERYTGQRASMVADVREQLRKAKLPMDGRMRAILAVIARLPREDFVPDEQRDRAYSSEPTAIGHGQTISDAFIMAYMTYALKLKRGDRVLEIGTGSGYQAAILGSLTSRVYTIEIIPELARRAEHVLREHGFDNVTVRDGDGYHGWPEAAPFDAIIVTAGAAHVPPALIEQLRPGGRMILPLGPTWATEQMTIVHKDERGHVHTRSCGWVVFVPFVGQAQTRVAGATGVWGHGHPRKCFEPLGDVFRPARENEGKQFQTAPHLSLAQSREAAKYSGNT